MTGNVTSFVFFSPALGPFGWTMLWIFTPLLISTWARLVWYKAHFLADVVPESGTLPLARAVLFTHAEREPGMLLVGGIGDGHRDVVGEPLPPCHSARGCSEPAFFPFAVAACVVPDCLLLGRKDVSGMLGGSLPKFDVF
jgi:hypothetical protein